MIDMNRLALRFLLALIVISIGYVAWFTVQRFALSTPQKVIAIAQEQRDAGNSQIAAETLTNGVVRYPDNADIRRFAAKLAAELSDWQAEFAHREWLYQREPDNLDNAYLLAERKSRLESMDLARAEELLLDVLHRDVSHALARDLLVRVLNQQGRRWETLPHLQWQIENDAFSLDTLMLLGNLSAALPIRQSIMAACDADQLDLPATLGVARVHFAAGNSARARTLLIRIVQQFPESTEAQVRLAEILQLDSPDQFEQWDNTHSPKFDSHPHLWLVRGRHAAQRGDEKTSISCFIRACEIDPTRKDALFRLSQTLRRQGKEKEAERLDEDIDRLAELATMVTNLFDNEPARAEMERCAELTLELNRVTEAFAWSRIILANSPDSARAAAIAVETASHESTTLIPGIVSSDLSRAHRIVGPLKWTLIESPNEVETLGHSTESIKFVAEPPNVFPEFQYFNGADLETQERRMFEFTGGGVAALDFDNDLWPDIFLSQGQHWSVPDDTLHDTLLRNRRGIGFKESTSVSLPTETGFGQGVSAADFNNDGFEDLLVCNIGQNQLLTNNGDGTYSDVTPFPTESDRIWTTSAAFADFDGDGDEDLYVGNFLGGEDVYTRVCGEEGIPRSCPPAGFPGEPDCVWENHGDGTWENVTANSGIVKERSNSLGIVVADFERTGHLAVFIANDSVANFYFRCASDNQLQFEECGAQTGLSLNQSGHTQACMGVAAADFDGNQLLDLCVTNFYEEPNAAYLQISNGVFIDSSREASLYDPSLKLLGFGTQPIDADLDGWLDLMITNGHVDDFTHEGIPFEMPPLFLRNLDGRRFKQPESLRDSDFLAAKELGRGMCRLDWNRDGRDDVCVSHLLSPGKLISNATKTDNDYIAIRLFRVGGSRTTVGTHLRISLPHRNIYRQAVSGDGYMASNEKQLIFGLGHNNNRGIMSLQVQWPKQQPTTHQLPLKGNSFALIEGRGFYSLPK